MEKRAPFSKWRQRLWPIYSFELKKLLPLFFMKFFISLNYGILTALKDTVIVTAKDSGAEVIPILKGWIVLPIALFCALFYSKLSNLFRRSHLFYGIITVFLIFFMIYAFLLFPNSESLSPHSFSDRLVATIGPKFQHWVAIIRHWMHALFFVSAELWGSLVIFMLFWGFSNEITHINEAKRFYTLFSAGGNLAAIATGPIVCFFTKKYAHVNIVFTQQILLLFVLFFGLVIMGLHFWITRFVIKDVKHFDPNLATKKYKVKTKLSLWKGIKYLSKSKYIRYLAIMVIGYGLTINLIEVTWKANLKLYLPTAAAYQSFMGTVSTYVGATAFIIALFIGSNVFRKFGWKISAMIPPIAVGASGILFLIFVLKKTQLTALTAFIGITPLAFIAFFGAFQNVLSKAVKYCFFDTSKEMAFIPLDQEEKVKGKAAIDVVGSRLGKSGAAWIQIFLIDVIGTGSILSVTYLLIPFVVIAVLGWARSIISLDKEREKIEEKAT